jgi:nitrite reductase (cytochrome c-552)
VDEVELKARAERIQEDTYALRNQAMDALMDLIGDLEAAHGRGVPETELATAREMQRRAQFYIDFVEAENSTGFHAPQEAARVLGQALDFARQGQIAVRDARFAPRIPGVADR